MRGNVDPARLPAARGKASTTRSSLRQRASARSSASRRTRLRSRPTPPCPTRRRPFRSRRADDAPGDLELLRVSTTPRRVRRSPPIAVPCRNSARALPVPVAAHAIACSTPDCWSSTASSASLDNSQVLRRRERQRGSRGRAGPSARRPARVAWCARRAARGGRDRRDDLSDVRRVRGVRRRAVGTRRVIPSATSTRPPLRSNPWPRTTTCAATCGVPRRWDRSRASRRRTGDVPVSSCTSASWPPLFTQAIAHRRGALRRASRRR